MRVIVSTGGSGSLGEVSLQLQRIRVQLLRGNVLVGFMRKCSECGCRNNGDTELVYAHTDHLIVLSGYVVESLSHLGSTWAKRYICSHVYEQIAWYQDRDTSRSSKAPYFRSAYVRRWGKKIFTVQRNDSSFSFSYFVWVVRRGKKKKARGHTSALPNQQSCTQYLWAKSLYFTHVESVTFVGITVGFFCGDVSLRRCGHWICEHWWPTTLPHSCSVGTHTIFIQKAPVTSRQYNCVL